MAREVFLTVLSSLLLQPYISVMAQSTAADDSPCLAPGVLDTGLQLAKRFQANATLSINDFRHLLKDLQTGLREYGGAAFIRDCSGDGIEHRSTNGDLLNCSDILVECPSIDAIFARHSSKEGLNHSQLSAALQQAVLSVTNPKCLVSQPLHKGYKPTTAQAWGYGIGFVTLVCIISNIGALLTPFMAKTFFQRMLQFLVAMGAGTLAATGLLVLIPEAFDIVSIEELGEDYIWKSTTALFSIYVFFVSERFLKFYLKSRENTDRSKGNMTLHVKAPKTGDEMEPVTSPENGQSDHSHSHLVTPSPTSGHKRGPVATVAWMVLIGDIMHNFVDGMAIGAAFTENVYLGVSIGIAVLCEELPHELGDVAILLHSGMSMKRALFLNFLSACVCYLGLIIGIVLGENTEANRWILAVAGGLFLYVPLVDMLPDMSQHLDKIMREKSSSEGIKRRGSMPREVWIVLFCQALGLFVGICIILVVINFSGMVDVGQ